MTDYYKVLGIERNATEDQIKSSYRELAKKYHPDTTTDETKKKEFEEKFKEISHAYNILSDPQERAAYDNPRPNVPPGFNPFMNGGGGFSFNMNDIFAKMGGMNFGIHTNGGQNFFTQQIVSVNVEISIQQMLLGGDVETDSPVGKIKFAIPPFTPPGRVFPVRVNQNNNPNQQLIIQVKIVLKMPSSLTEEQKKKIQELEI